MMKTTAAALPCPNCRQPMRPKEMERHDHGKVCVHLCFPCAGIWFDHLTSVQLAPASVIELFKEISANRDASRQPVANRLDCPRCRAALTLSHDLGKAGRFTYFMCHRSDGRFTPFFQFLREKQFIRNLTVAEIQRVRAEVRQVTCSECGAPIDLEHDSQCKYCHAPISFLDPDAVERAVRMWADADHRRHLSPTPEALGDALLRTQLHPPPRSRSNPHFGDRILVGGSGAPSGIALDLVALGIDVIAGLFQSRT